MRKLSVVSQVEVNGYGIDQYPVMEMRRWFGITCSPELCNEHDFRKRVQQ